MSYAHKSCYFADMSLIQRLICLICLISTIAEGFIPTYRTPQAQGFETTRIVQVQQNLYRHCNNIKPSFHSATSTSDTPTSLLNKDSSIWEQIASLLVNVEEDPSKLSTYVQTVTILRVGVPAFLGAAVSRLMYPTVAMILADSIHDYGVFAVVAQDSSQYIQNILTTSGLMFSILLGQTFCT
jgi:hypothetical protein